MWASFLRLLRQSWQIFLNGQGTTALGFASTWIVAAVSGLIVTGFIFRIRGKAEMMRHWKQNVIIVFAGAIGGNIVWYVPIFACGIVRTVYTDHQQSVTTIERLQGFAVNESRYRQSLRESQAKAENWREAYTGISKGEAVPDRIISAENADRLHDKLAEYAKHSGDSKYSTVRIAPAFYEDRESTNLAMHLLKIFKDSHWSAKWEGSHAEALRSLIYTSAPGVAIYSDDPHNQAIWIMWILKDAGIDAYVAEDTPPGFKGTLVCVEYKQNQELIQP
ncbi:hypothetical protein HNQ77_002170 [Silvibacterium bohemicum]|uniref:Uncharacterized protein n=1 Tax=Silvibacterium bohemicum TaxID=1577686 RepID=A0A841K0P0_9BACT|nr:hypothetical protein [Silvibacterium bohemicum]MBB6144218.1 hypothetical protein [Silvibacterium bohemicum]